MNKLCLIHTVRSTNYVQHILVDENGSLITLDSDMKLMELRSSILNYRFRLSVKAFKNNLKAQKSDGWPYSLSVITNKLPYSKEVAIRNSGLSTRGVVVTEMNRWLQTEGARKIKEEGVAFLSKHYACAIV